MALMRLNFFSEILGKNTYVNIILPQKIESKNTNTQKPYPVLYLLHGLSDDQDAWLRKTSIERYCEGRNLVVVMPSTDRGFYTDTTYGIKHYTYISEELPKILEQYLPLSTRREDNYTAGLSMGGYGALKLALRDPERFSFAASFSGAPMSREMIKRWGEAHDLNGRFAGELRAVFGTEFKPEDDIFRLLSKASPKPKLFVCCGMKDELHAANTALCETAASLGYNITQRFDEQYDHEWAYWDLMIQEVLNMLP